MTSDMQQNRVQCRRRGASPSRSIASGWLMLILGIFIGALGSAFYTGLKSGEPDRLGSGLNQLLEAPRPKVEAPAPNVLKREPVRTEFDFFTVLPEIERVIPETASVGQADDLKVAEKKVAISETQEGYYMLQAASYTQEIEADRMKLELAEAGFSSTIQHISIQGQGDFYRVRIGPFSSMSELEKVHSRLSRMGIKALRLKVSTP